MLLAIRLTRSTEDQWHGRVVSVRLASSPKKPIKLLPIYSRGTRSSLRLDSVEELLNSRIWGSHTRNTFITSSPRWLITFTAIRPDFGLSKVREVSLFRVAQASSLISALSVLFRALYG